MLALPEVRLRLRREVMNADYLGQVGLEVPSSG